MRARWFKTWGWIYRPVSWQGVVIILLAVAFSLQVFIAVDSRSHSASDTLYGVFRWEKYGRTTGQRVSRKGASRCSI